MKRLDKFDKQLGEKIRIFRMVKNISQEVIGLCLGMSKQQISNIERGKRGVRVVEIFKLSELFDVPFEAFSPNKEVKYQMVDK